MSKLLGVIYFFKESYDSCSLGLFNFNCISFLIIPLGIIAIIAFIALSDLLKKSKKSKKED